MLKVQEEKFLLSASRSLDFTYRGLLVHHQRVAYLSLVLGQAAGMGPAELYQLFKTAIIHDAGIASFDQKDSLAKFELETEARWEHCQRGFEFTRGIRALAGLAAKVLVHHDRWAGGNPSGFESSRIPLISRIVHLTDRVNVLIRDDIPILQQTGSIKGRIQDEAGKEFDPELVALLLELLRRDSLWLDLTAPWLEDRLLFLLDSINKKPQADLVDLARLFACVVDAKSRFTYHHSRSVAACARFLGTALGFGARDCSLLEAAGLLHDLGKITIPEHILEKDGRLTAAEFGLIKQHPYYTYWLLKPATEGLPLAQWAAAHHERLDGSGYPFQLAGEKIPKGARIIAVADIYTALREERPYRPSLSGPQIEKILLEQVRSGALDKKVVDALLSNRRQLELE